ncbi:helix-turn-helix domain-containing protein [Patescibacteria group bacterium]|nr:helix-turn-helix domain-containing protein [Patescibacteria group bacterium]
MKYDKVRKLTRDEILLKYRNEHPGYSLAEIGEFFGITKQRVSQILKGMKDRVFQ